MAQYDAVYGPGKCKSNHYANTSAQSMSMAACQAACDAEARCRFFSAGEGTSCLRYASSLEACTPLALPSSSWTTYQKLGLGEIAAWAGRGSSRRSKRAASRTSPSLARPVSAPHGAALAPRSQASSKSERATAGPR